MPPTALRGKDRILESCSDRLLSCSSSSLRFTYVVPFLWLAKRCELQLCITWSSWWYRNLSTMPEWIWPRSIILDRTSRLASSSLSHISLCASNFPHNWDMPQLVGLLAEPYLFLIHIYSLLHPRCSCLIDWWCTRNLCRWIRLELF